MIIIGWNYECVFYFEFNRTFFSTNMMKFVKQSRTVFFIFFEWKIVLCMPYTLQLSSVFRVSMCSVRHHKFLFINKLRTNNCFIYSMKQYWQLCIMLQICPSFGKFMINGWLVTITIMFPKLTLTMYQICKNSVANFNSFHLFFAVVVAAAEAQTFINT